MVTETVGAALREVALFHDLPAQELEVLARQVVQRRYSRQELIFSQGDRGDGLYVVREGHISISRQGLDGNELIIAVSEPGEYFGELALFDDEPRSASAIAIDDCTVLFLSRQAFREFIQTHPAAVMTCLAIIVHELRRCTELVDEIALLDVRRRLARRLLRLAEQGMLETGENGRRAGVSTLRITQQQLASMTGATRESVNKHLNSFVDEGLIRLDRGRISILDRDRLGTCAEGFV